jgi:hypothetical protein
LPSFSHNRERRLVIKLSLGVTGQVKFAPEATRAWSFQALTMVPASIL